MRSKERMDPARPPSPSPSLLPLSPLVVTCRQLYVTKSVESLSAEIFSLARTMDRNQEKMMKDENLLFDVTFLEIAEAISMGGIQRIHTKYVDAEIQYIITMLSTFKGRKVFS